MMRKLKNTLLLVLCIACATIDAGAAQPIADFTSVAKKALPAVVSIRTKAPNATSGPFQQGDPFADDLLDFFFGKPRREVPQQPQGQPPRVSQGSGFLVSSDGLMMTNSHVVRDAQEIRVRLTDGRDLEAKLIGHDPNTDVAIIKVDATDLPFLTFGTSSDLEVGQWAIAVGNPLGLQESLTVGVISAKGRANLDVADLEDFIQTDAAINRGNSGGPLLNIDGEVIGINTAIASSTGGYMGIGFAIPSDMAKHVMDELVAKGSVTRGFLGVVLQPIDYDLAMVFGLDKVEGALVAEVQEGSPADKAGLKRGDIILEHDGRRVESVASLRNAISLSKPGQTVNLKLLREGKTLVVKVHVGAHAESKEGMSKEGKNVIGIKVENAPSGQQGVVIIQVDPYSIAAMAGLKKDSVILEVNKQKVNSAEQFYKVVSGLSKGSRLLLFVRQADATGYVVLTLR
ncbi:MAG: Do family serine endopeptidase [Chlamydiales bacterium]|nr:Do family serine endopeptidase [Chlamydiales bacterium]